MPTRPADCGDGFCTHAETVAVCRDDCPVECSDGFCTDDTESASSCAVDCPADCGDGACTHAESACTCERDCDADCGDSCCTHEEDACACREDCSAMCGDGCCTHGETNESCPDDCDASCGDGFCAVEDEDPSSCESDCPAVCGDGAVTHDEECEGEPTRSCVFVCELIGTTSSQTCASCEWSDCEVPDEVCDGYDNDCDGTLMAGEDDDEDGALGPACGGADCDDTDPLVNRAALEDCATAYDDDCDDLTNERDAVGCIVFYRDRDGDDFYPAGAPSQCWCAASGEYRSTTPGDCDDTDELIYPDAEERCNDEDDDCDTDVDEDIDADSDGFTACVTSGAERLDCDDTLPEVNPDAEELCNGIDDDCDGVPDQICITAPGLQAYWRFEEASGVRYDETDNHNNLSETSAVGRAAGRVGYAADLERSTGSYLTIGHTPSLNITGDLTIVAWINHESFTRSEGDKARCDIVMRWDYPGGHCSYFFAIEGSYYNSTQMRSPRLYLWLNPPGGTCYSNGTNHTQLLPGTMVTGTWYHVAAVYDSATRTRRFYFNGARLSSLGSAPASIRSTSISTVVGQRPGSSDGRFDGRLDEVAIFNRALSDEEIAEIYAIGSE